MSGVRGDGVVFSFVARAAGRSSYAEAIDIRFEEASLHIDTYYQSLSYIYEHEYPKQEAKFIAPGITDYDVRFKGINSNWIRTIRQADANYLTDRDMISNSFMSVAFANRDAVCLG